MIWWLVKLVTALLLHFSPPAPVVPPAISQPAPMQTVEPGVALSVTAYCWTGNHTASGVWPEIGMAAGNRWPLGTVLDVEGRGSVTITDRIGWGSDLDLYMGQDGCLARANEFGRQTLLVRVVSTPGESK